MGIWSLLFQEVDFCFMPNVLSIRIVLGFSGLFYFIRYVCRF